MGYIEAGGGLNLQFWRKKIFQKELKELQLERDVWGVGNKKQSRDVKALDIFKF